MCIRASVLTLFRICSLGSRSWFVQRKSNGTFYSGSAEVISKQQTLYSVLIFKLIPINSQYIKRFHKDEFDQGFFSIQSTDNKKVSHNSLTTVIIISGVVFFVVIVVVVAIVIEC